MFKKKILPTNIFRYILLLDYWTIAPKQQYHSSMKVAQRERERGIRRPEKFRGKRTIMALL